MTLLVWHTLTSPQPSSPQVMNRKLPNPKIVSSLQLERRAAFHINYSHHQAHLLTNSTQQYTLYVCQIPGIFSDSMDGFALSFPSFKQGSSFFPNDDVTKRPFLCLVSFLARKAAMFNVADNAANYTLLRTVQDVQCKTEESP